MYYTLCLLTSVLLFNFPSDILLYKYLFLFADRGDLFVTPDSSCITGRRVVEYGSYRY